MRVSELKALLRADKEAWGNQSNFRLSVFHPEFRIMKWKRYCDFLRDKPYAKVLYYLSRYVYHHNCRKCGCDIPSSVAIGGGIKIPHGWGIVINSKARIGERVSIVSGRWSGVF